MRSLSPTMNHDGSLFQAALLTLTAKSSHLENQIGTNRFAADKLTLTGLPATIRQVSPP